MDKLLKAKEEIIAEIAAIKSVSVADRVAVKIAELTEQLTAEYEADDAAQLAELEVGLKFIDRAIARAEADAAVSVEAEVAPVEADEVAVEAVAVEEEPAV